MQADALSPATARAHAATVRRIVGPTVLLGSGRYFDFEAPERTPMTIEDVAYGLAYKARFSGQCVSRLLGRRVFYSVAQHCVLASRIVPPEHAHDALMHDVAEAAMVDMPQPLKAICPDYKAVEARVEAALFAQFGVEMRDPDLIKRADLRMLATEKRDLMPCQGDEWAAIAAMEPLEGHFILPLGPDEAAEAFLARYREVAP